MSDIIQYPMNKVFNMYWVCAVSMELVESTQCGSGGAPFGGSPCKVVDNLHICSLGLRNAHKDFFALPHPLLISHTYLETLVSAVSVLLSGSLECVCCCTRTKLELITNLFVVMPRNFAGREMSTFLHSMQDSCKCLPWFTSNKKCPLTRFYACASHFLMHGSPPGASYPKH